MPYKSEWIEPQLALEYKGITVHTVYKDLEFDFPLNMWYAVYPRDEDGLFDWSDEGTMGQTREFDIREYTHYAGVRIDGAVKKADEHMAILRTLIDAGILTQDGIREPESKKDA